MRLRNPITQPTKRTCNVPVLKFILGTA